MGHLLRLQYYLFSSLSPSAASSTRDEVKVDGLAPSVCEVRQGETPLGSSGSMYVTTNQSSGSATGSRTRAVYGVREVVPVVYESRRRPSQHGELLPCLPPDAGLARGVVIPGSRASGAAAPAAAPACRR
jgi:hypothetical protein